MQASVTASAVLARAPEKPQTRGTCLAQMPRCPVAQFSNPAVSPISKSAELGNGLRVWKPAIQQTRKSAPRQTHTKRGVNESTLIPSHPRKAKDEGKGMDLGKDEGEG